MRAFNTCQCSACVDSQKVPSDLWGPLWKQTSLRDLRLVANHIKVFHPKFFLFTNLTSLVLRHNELEELPEAFYLFSKLTSLVLEGNILKRLPPNFHTLTNLTVRLLFCCFRQVMGVFPPMVLNWCYPCLMASCCVDCLLLARIWL